MKKFVIAALGGTVAGLLMTTQFAGPLIAQEADKPANVYKQLDLFGDVFERIRSDYVEEVDESKLIEAAINGMLTSLDPHSSFMNAEAYTDMRTQTRGSFGGLGIEVTQEDGFVKVVTPMDGTPADAAGVEAGDFITHVDGESLMGLQLDDAVELMRGEVGSEIVITVVREGEPEPFDISIIRDTIKMTAVKGRTEGNVVVLRITTFNDQTFANLKENLDKSVKELGGMDKVTGFVIDLRNNPGGLLNQAVMVSDAFMESGEIVSTRGRNPDQAERFNAEAGDLAEGKPMVVLVNGGSASAAEIVTGALQDHHRAIVVGTRSFGKGSVQTVMPVGNGDGGMRLTTARYYTPSGRSIQALGIAPDIIVEQPRSTPAAEDEADAEESSIAKRTRSEADLRGAISNDSMTEDEKQQALDELAKAEEVAKLRDSDYQLAYAIDILKGLSVLQPGVEEAHAAAQKQ